ncbi:MAG: hypothetical protein IJA97_02415, partial [Clostridia bacterium]|nr:hypothetical protein [Clostridia bacterium]
MKKFFAKILSCALAVIMAMFVLNGCALITTNTERDMAQVIATVAVDDALKEDVYKRELVSAYNSQGYYYVQYQGMTEAEVYDMMLEDIVRNRILKQQAKLAFTGKTTINDEGYFAMASKATNKTSYDNVLSGQNWNEKDFTSVKKTDSIDQFMTEYEYYTIQYNVLSSIKQLIDGYVEEEDEHEHDAYETFQGEVRTSPTQEADKTGNEYEMQNDPEISVIDEEGSFYKNLNKINEDAGLGLNLKDRTEYPTKYKLALAVYKAYVGNFDNSIKDNRAEINKIIRDLKNLGFISTAEASGKTPMTKKDILALTYFADALEIQYENMLIEKYELALQNEQEKLLAGPGALYSAYSNIYETQKNKFDSSYTDYETALENASDSNLVLYNPAVDSGKYGYVLNLLIGFSEEQSAILTALDEKTTLKKEDKINARNALLETLVAKDQRASWVESNYGTYNEESNTFTFSKAYFNKYSENSVLNTFKGDLYGAKKYTYHDSYDVEVDGYSFDAVKANEIPFNTFYNDIVCGVMTDITGRDGKIADLTDDKINSFKDIIYAYSTDPGSLTSANGYVYSPKTSATTYVKE